MIHGINNNYLYAVSHAHVSFTNASGEGVESSGTGFFVVKDRQLYFITNRHVIDIASQDAKYAGYALDSIRFDVRKYDEKSKNVVAKTYEVGLYRLLLPDNDLDDIACISHMKLIGENVNLKNAFPFELLADSECLEKQMSVCDSVAIIGFPSVYDHLNDLPVLRAGVISSDPRLDYSYNHSFIGHVIAYEAFSTDGASGSPVIALQKGFPVGEGLSASDDFFRPVKIIGVNAGSIIEFEQENKQKEEKKEEQEEEKKEEKGVHQHMSYMYKSDVIRKLILQAEQSKTPEYVNRKLVCPVKGYR